MNPFDEENNINPFDDNNTTNPFETSNDSESNVESMLLNIEIWVGDRGKKYDTYISGLPYNKNELLDHLKILKKNKGCNGSVKLTNKDDIDQYVLHLQGNHKEYLKEYFTKLGINNIKVKG